ncbi:MAG: hypothetical protein ACOYO0_14115 [Sandarakinorhabdus sp.]|jgi:hypothetical protein
MALITRFVTRSLAAVATRQIAARVAHGGLGPFGNAAAVALPFVLGRVSPLGLAAVAVGAWAVGRLAQDAAAPAADRTPADY